MIWLWLISFSAGLLGLPASGATVSGRVQILPAAKSKSVPTHDAGVVVWLENPSLPVPAPASARMMQRRKVFQPHVLAIPVGSTVEFPNFDPIFHNAFSNGGGDAFDVGLYPPGGTRKVVFRQPGIVRVFCNIHQSMSAVIVVERTPYMAVSDAAGSFSLPNVGPGDYTLRVFYERATGKTLDALSREVRVGAEPVTLPPLAVSEAGYIPVPHKNKHGEDYPPEPPDAPAYGSAGR